MTIGTLPDNVLLEIFVYYRDNHGYPRNCTIWKWHTLVHICRRWRQIIFTSPRRLNLQIVCTYNTPVRKNLSIWPPFPIAIDYGNSCRFIRPNDEENIIAALAHPDRVRYLGLDATGLQLKKMVPVMQNPLPILTHLYIFLQDGNSLVLPVDFLGGSPPCLQEIYFDSFPFPALPTLLLSASDLVTLKLHGIPPNGYISPDTMVASLAALTRLKNLSIKFDPFDDQPIPTHLLLPMTRTVLPALTSFEFLGASDYLEVLVAPIDGAQLNWIMIDYVQDNTVGFPAVEFSRFFNRSVHPGIMPFTRAEVSFTISVTFDICRPANISPSNTHPPSTHLSLECEGSEWNILKMAQVFSQFSEILSNVVYLKLRVLNGRFEGSTGVEWLHFLDQLSMVQALYVARWFAESVALALENITGERVAKAWSSLELICLENQPVSSIEKFVSARQLAGRPVTVIHTEEEFDQRLVLDV